MTLSSRLDSDSPLGSLHSDRMEIRRLRTALQTAQGEAYLGALEGDDTPDPLAACHNVLKVCLEALNA